MNAQNTEKKPMVKRETKNKIRVEFDRTPLMERLKAKFLSFYFLQKVAIAIFRMVLMVGISYIVLFPFLSKITGSIMAPQDFLDPTVLMIPKNISFDIYEAIVNELGYFSALGNTFLLSFSTAVIQMLICSLIGYGFAKFKFRGRNLVFVLVMITMIIPHQTLQHAMFLEFRNFDILGIVRLLKGGGIQIFDWNITQISEGAAEFFANLNILPDEIIIGIDEFGDEVGMEFRQTGINISGTYLPLILLSVTGLAFKNGLYILYFTFSDNRTRTRTDIPLRFRIILANDTLSNVVWAIYASRNPNNQDLLSVNLFNGCSGHIIWVELVVVSHHIF